MAEPGHPAGTRVFVTPRAEVEATCRLALGEYLCRRLPDVPEATVFSLGGAGQGCSRGGAETEVSRYVAGAREDRLLDAGKDGHGGDRATSRGGEGGNIKGRGRREHWETLYAVLKDIRVVDPACGEGHFLSGMLDLLDEVGCRLAHRLDLNEDQPSRRRRIVERNLYGVEVQEEALGRARRRLVLGGAPRSSVGPGGPPGLYAPIHRRLDPPWVAGRRLNLAAGDSLVEREIFRWNIRFRDVAMQGGFDLVIGNPPFVRHEQIADPLGELERQAYKRRAVDAVHARLASFFGWDPVQARAMRPLDGRTDLALLFAFLSLSLLRPEGVLGFVFPVATLDARYGKRLVGFLEQTGRRALVLESCGYRSFAQASVNTAILVASPAPPNVVRSPSRAGGRELVLRHERTDGPIGSANLERAFRGRVQADEALSSRLIRALDGRTAALGSLGRLRYPIKSGINRFFYPDPATVARFGIEPEFLRPVLKSPCQVQAIALDPSRITSLLFSCGQSIADLVQQGKDGAAEYIRWGEEQRTSSGQLWPCVPSVRGRKYWYCVPLPRPAAIICPRLFDRRFFFVTPAGALLEDQTFYGLLLDDQHLRDAVAALLNSSLTYLLVEARGRTGLGDGVLQHALCDMAALPVLDPRPLSRTIKHELIRAFRPVAERRILPIEDEVRQADRETLDAVVGASAGLSEGQMRTVREMLVQRTAQRYMRARSVHPSPSAPRVG